MENAENAHKGAGSASLAEHPRFALFTSDFTFKKAFAENDRSEYLLTFLLNVFLKEKLKSPIEEAKIISNEILGETKHSRGAVFDIHCRDASGTRFIVEVQVGEQEHFVKRTFFYLCMIISRLANKGKDYDFNLPKLYSVSFLEFDLDFGENCTEVIQYLSVRNDKHPEVGYDMLQMVYVILPRFRKTDIECETVMDKIIFSLKHGHELESVPKNFTEEELGLLFDLAEISNFTEDELREYGAAMMNRYDYKASIDYAEKKGEVKGIAIGEAKGMEKVFALLDQGVSLDDAKRKLGMQ
jgi:predicted transposase/invertase (TIGR01784 family)